MKIPKGFTPHKEDSKACYDKDGLLNVLIDSTWMLYVPYFAGEIANSHETRGLENHPINSLGVNWTVILPSRKVSSHKCYH